MNNFRGKTCGECAWVYVDAGMPFCRRVSWNTIPIRNDVQYSGHGRVTPSTPACPSFVTIKEEVEE